MAPLEPWQRVWIDAELYAQDLHSKINCTDCHGGQANEDMDAAHEGMVASPAADAPATCGNCHTDITPASMNSLHTTLRGYDTVLYERSAPEHFETLETAEQYHCNSCHTTCGDCHVSQPNSVGGGLLKGHTFVQTPPMSQTCTACHGSRVKNEYYGLNEGVPSDVHFRARMSCSDCHTGDEIHGVGVEADHRYDGTQSPDCISCHQDQVGVGSGIEQHEIHGTELLSCQTCHSTTYTSCVNCHVEQTDDQQPFYRIEDHFLTFLIGQNPIRNQQRPYRYVPVRHVPSDRDSFSFYGEDLLINFDRLPTWAYSTPHNIQRITPQSETCTACHSNDSVFLTADKVAPAELVANAGVIVERAPALPEKYADRANIATPTTPAGGSEDSFWGSDTTGPAPTTSADDSFWGGAGEAVTPSPAPSGSDDSFWGADTSQPVEPTPGTPESDDAFWGGG